MEQMLERLHRECFGYFVGVINALENHVQEGDGDPIVVRHLGDAILALAARHRLEARVTKKLTQLLGQLHSHVAARAEQRPGR